MPIFVIDKFKGLAINPVPSHDSPTGLFNLTLDRTGGYIPFGQIKTLKTDFPAALELLDYDSSGLSAYINATGSAMYLLNKDVLSSASSAYKTYSNQVRIFPGVGCWQTIRAAGSGDTKNPPISGVTNDVSVGALAWTSPENAGGAADGSPASAGPTTTTTDTNYLRASFPTNNFAIPANATILGIRVGYLKRSVGNVYDNYIQLIKGGVIQAANRADSTAAWTSNTYAWVYAGGSTDLWGTSWTPADVNATSFGAVLAAKLVPPAGGSVEAKVDAIEIAVYYSTPISGSMSVWPVGVYRAKDGAFHYPTNITPYGAAITSIVGSLTDPKFGLLYWVAGTGGAGLVALLEYNQTGASLGMKVNMSTAPANTGVNVYYYDSVNKNHIFAGTVLAGNISDFTAAPTGEGIKFKLSLSGSNLTELHNNRLYEVSSEIGIQDTTFLTFKASKYDYGKSVIFWSDTGSPQISISPGYIPEPEPGTTALVSHPGGLTIFSANNAYLLSGDPGSVQTVSVEKYPSPVGCDAGVRPAVWGSSIFTIWKGRLFMVSGGQVEEVGLPVWLNSDPFIQVAVDPPNNDIVVRTAGSKIYRFDPERRSWSNNVISGDYKLLPNPNGLYYLYQEPVEGLGSIYLIDRIGAGTTPILKYGPLDLGLGQHDKQFRRVYFSTDGYTGTPTLDVDVDGQTATISGQNLGQGRFEFVLPGYVGRYITMTFNFVGAAITSVIRPPIEIEYIPRRRYR